MNKSLLKWSPACPFKKPDNIISSNAKDRAQFKPSYENDPIENMNFLMSNEYMRIWFKEKAVYDKDTYTKEQIIKDESKIKRRIIQRMMTYRRPSKNQFIDNNIKKRSGRDQSAELKNQIKDQEKMKYKPACPIRMGGEVNKKSELKQRSAARSRSGKAKIHKDKEDDDLECNDTCEILLQCTNCDGN